MEIKINEVEVQKLNLQPGEILVVKVRSDVVRPEDMDILASQFRKLIPGNKVAVLMLGENDNIDLTIAKGSEYPEVDKSSSPCSIANYCNDCSCGKKEIAEALKKG